MPTTQPSQSTQHQRAALFALCLLSSTELAFSFQSIHNRHDILLRQPRHPISHPSVSHRPQRAGLPLPQHLNFHVPSTCFAAARATSISSFLLMSSIGGGDEDDPFGRNNDDNKNNNPLNEWMKRRESDNARFAREQFAETRLPISYGAINNGNEQTFGPLSTPSEEDDAPSSSSNSSSSSSSSSSLARRESPQQNEPNPYLKVVSRLTPSDLISRFTATASPRVQDAVRTTILGLIGGLPQMAFETRTIATGERLASLMFQLQMTGYMFKNAEYRLSLSQSLAGGGGIGGRNLLSAGREEGKEWREGKLVNGKIKVRYGGNNNGGTDSPSGDESSSNTTSASSSGLEIEVDAEAYMSELRNEVSNLREELASTKQAKEEEIRKDLLLYIRTLPARELKELTGTMSPEVLDAMKGLVTAVLAGIGNDDEERGGKGAPAMGLEGMSATVIGPKTVTEQSGEALAQLCMWQLVVGYNLRELEVREEFRASLKALGSGGDGRDGGSGGTTGGVQFGPGALE
ncbi:hypothetical protein ACHAXS_011959 [Conticribra weissflogii]